MSARRQPTSEAASARAGFLLVEALTAMAIGALLLVALGSLVSLVLRASDRTTADGEQIEATSRVLSALVGRIETITPQRWAGPGAGFVFDGTETRLLFARRAVADGGGSESRLVVLSGEGRVLREDERPLPPDARDPASLAAGEGAVVLQDRFTVRFAYFSRLADGTEALTDRWPGAETLPVAVRVALSDADGTPRGSVRVAIRVDAEPVCAAPGQGLCSLVPRDGAGPDAVGPDGAGPDADRPDSAPIDPDDATGWGRYLAP